MVFNQMKIVVDITELEQGNISTYLECWMLHEDEEDKS
jgi:hypothetical protein